MTTNNRLRSWKSFLPKRPLVMTKRAVVNKRNKFKGVVILSATGLDQESFSLMQKIVGAIGLNDDQVRYLNLNGNLLDELEGVFASQSALIVLGPQACMGLPKALGLTVPESLSVTVVQFLEGRVLEDGVLEGQGHFKSALLVPAPQEIIKNPALKRPVWEALKVLSKKVGFKPVPARRS